MNTNCQHYEETCSLYVEHDLPQSENDRFAKHLKACTACQQKVARLKLIRTNLRQLSTIQPSRDFDTVLKARIQMSKNVGRGQWATNFDRMKFPAYTLSMAAVVATIFFLHISTPPGEQTTPLHSSKLEQSFATDEEIQAGEIVYSVDVLTQPQRSRSIKVPEKRKSSVMRSMIIAPGATQIDSVRSGLTGENAANEDHYSVSF
ncbi:zf-HC2 domain-containing protein [candidate division KSB1 bacterium]|nr:zf-HC2 domain-containing protein [candidate division KSB1 bacterium]